MAIGARALQGPFKSSSGVVEFSQDWLPLPPEHTPEKKDQIQVYSRKQTDAAEALGITADSNHVAGGDKNVNPFCQVTAVLLWSE